MFIYNNENESVLRNWLLKHW